MFFDCVFSENLSVCSVFIGLWNSQCECTFWARKYSRVFEPSNPFNPADYLCVCANWRLFMFHHKKLSLKYLKTRSFFHSRRIGIFKKSKLRTYFLEKSPFKRSLTKFFFLKSEHLKANNSRETEKSAMTKFKKVFFFYINFRVI